MSGLIESPDYRQSNIKDLQIEKLIINKYFNPILPKFYNSELNNRNPYKALGNNPTKKQEVEFLLGFSKECIYYKIFQFKDADT